MAAEGEMERYSRIEMAILSNLISVHVPHSSSEWTSVARELCEETGVERTEQSLREKWKRMCLSKAIQSGDPETLLQKQDDNVVLACTSETPVSIALLRSILNEALVQTVQMAALVELMEASRKVNQNSSKNVEKLLKLYKKSRRKRKSRKRKLS